MSGIRPFEPADVPAAVALFERMQQSGSSLAGLEALYRALLFEDPWADPELPSLVYEDENGELAGYITRCTRRFRFDAEPVRLSTTIHFFVDPAVRRKAVGALLSARLLGGAQDASHTEGPTEATLRMWRSMRGEILRLESLEWTRVLRPAAYWGDRLGGGAARAGRALAAPLDKLLGKVAGGGEPRLPRGVRDEPLTPALMVAHLAELTDWARLRPDYDEPYLRFLFGQLEQTSSYGDVSARLVRRDGAVIGWHVGFVRAGGHFDVLQVAGRPEDMPDLFDALLAHAWQAGAVAVRGRLDAPLAEAVTRDRSILRAGTAVLLRARAPELPLAALRGQAQLSRLDSNVWMDSAGR